MKSAIFRAILATFWLISLYPISGSIARADDWGCQVILCLSNPGGATEFAECRPPIEKLWRHLARGHSFPICTGVGFKASRPGYEPYYCNDGFRLVYRGGDHGGQEVGCVSTERQVVNASFCRYDENGGSGAAMSARWERVDGRYSCTAIITQGPNIREKPRFVDVTIDGVGRQRVWF